MKRATLAERFARCTVLRGECLEWRSPNPKDGYARMYVGYGNERKARLVHRVAWEMANGEIPNDKVIMHTCDNRCCVRIEHLRLGTQVENILDMCKKGRQRSRAYILSDEEMNKLRERREAGITYRALGKEFGVSYGTARRICVHVPRKFQ